MKKIGKALLLVLLLSLLVSTLSTVSFASEEEKVTLRTAYAPVYGGAKAMATLTFDDSVYPTALLVQQMCEKYGMEATMMMIVQRVGASGSNYADLATWTALFAKGQLEPQSHSYSHIDLRSYTENGAQNQSEAIFTQEIVTAKSMLEEMFPNYDILTFAPSFGALSANANTLARAHYYAIRGVGRSNIQTTNPGTSGGSGSWANLYSPSVVLEEATEEEQIAFLKANIDEYVEAGGWYTPFIHKVGDVSGTEMSAAVTDAYFAYLDSYQEKGDLWVTKHSSAVKYIRERQNSTCTAYMQNGKIYVSSTMASQTADGLPLSTDVFNHPLTVCVALPEDCQGVTYTLGGETQYRVAKKKGNTCYAYIDVLPDGTETVVTTVEGTPEADDSEHPLSDIVLDTDYGKFTIPEAYADAEAYPWVAFKEDGTFIAASDIFCTSDDSITCIIKQQYHNADEKHYIFLRRNFTHARNETFWNFANLGSELVIDLMGNTFTVSQITSNGLFFGEGKGSRHVRLTIANGKLQNETNHPIFFAQPGAKAGAHFDITFKDMTLSCAGFVANVKETDKASQKYTLTFIDTTLDISTLATSEVAFVTGSPYDNVDANVIFRGGTIKGDLTRLVRMRGFSYRDVTFEKNDKGEYTTNTLAATAVAPARIVSSPEGLLTFSTGVADAKDASLKVYTPAIEASPLATKYGWLPDDGSSMVVFDTSTQKMVYSGEKLVDYYSSVDHESVFLSIDSTTENLLVYFRKDVGTSAFTGTFYNLSRKSNTTIFELNGHTLTLAKTLFRAQVKSANMFQKFRMQNGTIDQNGCSLISTGSNANPTNGRVDFVFENVTFKNIKSSSVLITDNVDTCENLHTFHIDFNECAFHTTSAYAGKFFNFTKTTPVHHVRINGGSINASKSVLPTFFYAKEGNASTLTFAVGADGKYPSAKTTERTEKVYPLDIPTPYGMAQYANMSSIGGTTNWELVKVTPYGYIDGAHFDEEKYPMVLFFADKTLYPVAYGGYDAETVVQRCFRDYPSQDATLYFRRDYTITGENHFTGNLKNTFVIDLGGNTIKMDTALLFQQSRSSNECNIVVKNGTLAQGAGQFFVYGTTGADKKHSNIVVENVTFTGITKRLLGQSAFASKADAPERDLYTMSADITFNGCTFEVSSSMSSSERLFLFGDDERGTIRLHIRGGKFLLQNNNPEIFVTGWDGRTLDYGTFGDDAPKIVIAKNVDFPERGEMGADGLPMQFRKSEENATSATYTLTPFSVVSAYLNLTNDLNFIYRVFLPRGFENPTATFEVGGFTIVMNDYTVDKDGLCLFKLSSLGPHRMGDTVTIHVSATYNGETVTKSNSSLSVKSYAALLREQNKNDTELHTLLDTLLVYGANAQLYMNYNTDNLVAQPSGLIDVPAGTITKSGTYNTDYALVSAGLRLGGAFDFRLRVRAKDLAGLVLKVSKDGKETTLPITESDKSGDYYVICYNGVYASELSKNITFALVKNGEQVGEAFTLSAHTYLAHFAEDENENLANLAKALYLYSLAVSAYNSTPVEDQDYVPSGEIVNKGGAEGTVSYVIDDNDHATATFANSCLSKYPNLTLTYAVRTRYLATLLTEEGPDGLLRYRQSADGSYLYTLNEASVAFWRDITASDRVELVNHTHTHTFWGTNDDGGEFKYLKTSDLNTVLTSTQPVGSSSKEVYASMQILKDLFGDLDRNNTLSYILAGIGVYTGDREVNGETIESYNKYFNSLLKEAITNGKLATARSTFQVAHTNSASKVVGKEDLVSAEQRMNVNAYMILNANAGENIENWTAYIDHALEQGGWAPFCIHLITEKEHSSHHILQSQADALFAYTASLGDRVWVATYTDASLYFCEWSSATVDCKYLNKNVIVTITDKENDDIFNMPLTVKVTLPPSFGNTAFADGEALEVHEDTNGSYFVYVDVVPDGDAVSISAS